MEDRLHLSWAFLIGACNPYLDRPHPSVLRLLTAPWNHCGGFRELPGCRDRAQAWPARRVMSSMRRSRHQPRSRWVGSIITFMLVASACTQIGGAPDLGSIPVPGAGRAQAPSAAAPSTSSSESSPSVLSSDDLFAIYRAIMTRYVDQVQDCVPILGALHGAHNGAMEAGLLPIETALLDTAPIQFTNDPQADWARFGNAYDLFVRKFETRLDVAPVGEGAAKGMLAALGDPLSEYVDATTLAAMQSPTYGS